MIDEDLKKYLDDTRKDFKRRLDEILDYAKILPEINASLEKNLERIKNIRGGSKK